MAASTMATPTSPDARLFAGLAGLTLATGMVDAACYFGLGHVFTANMTGNVVFLGFALGGASGFSAAASLVAVAGFVAGAITAGRLVRPATARRDVRAAFAVEGVALTAATVIALSVAAPGTGAPHWILLTLLGIAMGVQNAAVRRLAVADMTTTVLTQTLTGLVADSVLAGGSNPRLVRRASSVLLMLTGGLIGAVLWNRGLGWPVLTGSLLVVSSTAVLAMAGPR
ncbi:MAG TPA: YoaK family protein [Candidatus Angelobacter sp.]|jgi:uncharacterized membrane protein YoaK (UPF0700 family)|nr:YoaK family protein [Candidatus Angelobacter sp.]